MADKKSDQQTSRLDIYIKEFENDVNVTVENFKEKSLLVTSIRAKWLRYYHLEMNLLDKLKAHRGEVSKLVNNEIFGGSKGGGALKNNPGMDLFIDSSPALEKADEVKAKILICERCMDYIERALHILDTFNFQIKNFIDILKLEHGGL
jgi:hypothetical protein